MAVTRFLRRPPVGQQGTPVPRPRYAADRTVQAPFRGGLLHQSVRIRFPTGTAGEGPALSNGAQFSTSPSSFRPERGDAISIYH
jgi:hypothetical protein